MPAPVALTFALLLGWPVLQLASVLLVRARRQRLHALAAELKVDPHLRSDDHGLVDRFVLEANGRAAFVLAPFALPALILAVALAKLLGRQGQAEERVSDRTRADIRSDVRLAEVDRGFRSGRERIDHDPRFQELKDLSRSIAFARWPVTSILSFILCLLVLPIFLFAYGSRATREVIPALAEVAYHAIQIVGIGVPTKRA